ncbi:MULTISPECIES: D-alanyl-D-alanine carboxypeptidase family protein [Roseovarius]|uniref:D-alanyl-D-alanine carboxypeptidase family protein n=1 Tax=Roseovarius TaxID=74030 RepID=UPI000C466102|nr:MULTISPECIES: D-alanyl-D-alanine carboxypeptidase family protein [Roseovarius]MAO26057.1 D-alanyl-D-alanine carboxypeptidase [Roseovarius sp.]MAZ21690.1 D-alanyl-D-alanine carboxypeptidase [Roseovarius sp.]MBU3000988.1 D-alanyl-D-alanine carboxypeptidase [Roseovarius nubinhibens]
MTLLPRIALSLLLALGLALGLTQAARAFDTRATAAYVMDVGTGTVLLAKNADQPLPPASMSKLMTLYVTFEAIRDGRLSMTETLPVSAHAARYGGSTLFLQAGERVSVEDLLRGIIVLSGNDACVVLAESLSPDGTEAGFARFMTRRAQNMGMTNSAFTNSNGWPAPGHRMSMRDLGLLARKLIEDFPEFYPMFAEEEFLFDEKESQNRYNRNPLLGLGIGADGLKTGHTAEAGYGLVGSAVQNGRRVIFVISGLASAEARAEEAEAIVNWAFRQFAEQQVVRGGVELARAKVWMGDATTVGLEAAEDVRTLMPAMSAGPLKAEVVYTGPIEAPVKQGDKLAELVFAPEGLPETRIPLVASASVARGGFSARLQTVTGLLLGRLQKGPAPEAAPADPAAEGAS